METTTHYGIAGLPNGKFGMLFVTKAGGARSTQTWTGEEFRTREEAERAMIAANEALLQKRCVQ